MTPQERQLKIRALLARLDALEGGPVGKEVQDLLSEEANRAGDLVRNSPTTKAVSVLSKELAKVKADPRISNLEKGVENVSRETDGKLQTLVEAFSTSIGALEQSVAEAEARGGDNLSQSLQTILGQLSVLSEKFDLDYAVLDEQGKRSLAEAGNVRQEAQQSLAPLIAKDTDLERSIGQVAEVATRADTGVVRAEQSMKQMGDDLMEEIKRLKSRQNNGNGNMNRNIAVGGNTSVLSKWTDINLKPGAGTLITYAANDTTGYTDITITATGSGSGITRQINNVSTPTVMDATPSIDQVYLVSGNTTMTLPTAVGNTNLYTVKNVGVGTVIINTTGGETIDNDSNVTMPVRYTSVDLISNGTNWQIT
jgi:hypothetical protein